MIAHGHRVAISHAGAPRRGLVSFDRGVVLENYWDYSRPIFPTGQIELQNHGNTLYFKNIYLKELPRP